jgi:uncharacterized protein YebE (UPF0316 family)
VAQHESLDVTALLASGFELTNLPAWLVLLVIFLLRCTDTTLSTLRMLAVVRGRRVLAWFLGFCGSLLFISAVAVVLDSFDRPLNILAYAAGFASGNVLGIVIEDRRAVGHSLLRIVSPERGPALIEALRTTGRGATELPGRSAGGTVTMIYCYIPRRQVPMVRRQIAALDPLAMVTVEHVRQLEGGWQA